MRSYRLTVAYDGAQLLGWQRQSQGRTVQGELELAWSKVTGERLTITGSGRTDSGVHALAQIASLESGTQLTPYRLRGALNAHLPDDIRVREVAYAKPGFHALRDTYGKRYRYLIQDGQPYDPTARHRAWHVKSVLDVDAMQRAAQVLLGTHDFETFETGGSQRLSSRRTITDILVIRQETDFGSRVVVEVAADGFLYNMVRNITGTLVMVGRHKQPESWVADLLASKNRRLAGEAAPAHGLYLVEVYYQAE
ncbi:MAG: tRNA pseudouridine(38-40) synthase TruA [Planctomycetota bacterium]